MTREEAIDIIRKNIPHLGIGATEMTEALKSLIPELRESEDERIRKELIEQVGYIIPDKEEYDDDGRVLPTYHKRIERYRAWLEKQKEQKSNNPDEIINLKFSVGDVVCRKGWADHTIKELFIGKEPVYICTNDEGLESHIPYSEQDEWELKQKEQKPAWSEEYHSPECGTTAGVWSDEDEDMLNSCISSIEEAKENRYAYKETDGDTSYDHEIAWLKSLRPPFKPNKEQMDALLWCIAHLGGADRRVLAELYEHLKMYCL